MTSRCQVMSGEAPLCEAAVPAGKKTQRNDMSRDVRGRALDRGVCPSEEPVSPDVLICASAVKSLIVVITASGITSNCLLGTPLVL